MIKKLIINLCIKIMIRLCDDYASRAIFLDDMYGESKQLDILRKKLQYKDIYLREHSFYKIPKQFDKKEVSDFLDERGEYK
jgi:hypothetical protein